MTVEATPLPPGVVWSNLGQSGAKHMNWILLALLLAISFCRVRALAVDPAISNACSHLNLNDSGEYTLSIPSEHKSVNVVLDDSRDGFSKLPDGHWRAGRQVRASIIPMVLAACENGTNGPAVLDVSS